MRISILYLFICLLCNGCATASQARFSTSRPTHEVFEAAQLSASKTGFTISQSDEERGFLRGNQGTAMGSGAPTFIDIQINEFEKGSKLNVSITPPVGTFGNTSSLLGSFESLLSQQIKDLTQVTEDKTLKAD
jgi:hypothetical protein